VGKGDKVKNVSDTLCWHCWLDSLRWNASIASTTEPYTYRGN